MSPVKNGTNGHEKYVELCAIATSGALTAAEERDLRSHLSECSSCRKHFAQFTNVIKSGIPLIAPNHEQRVLDIEWDEEAAHQRLLAKVQAISPIAGSVTVPRIWWGLGSLRLAGAAVCLITLAALTGYTVGKRQLPTPRHIEAVVPSPEKVGLESKMSEELTLKAEALRSAELEKQVEAKKLDDLKSKLKTADERIADLSAENAAGRDQLLTLKGERDSLDAQFREAERKYQAVELELNTIKSQYNDSLVKLASLKSDNQALNLRLQEKDELIADRNQFLSSDRDIRELMGARQLYIADVVDVDTSGKRRAPFGRVFYTKNKSLIFYAFDLDEQPQIKSASAFQVWGERDFGHAKPLSLGILYMDSASDRRWLLRFDDPAKLSDIDAVFVTVEPFGGSHKPTGKQLLYASLRKTPNHP